MRRITDLRPVLRRGASVTLLLCLLGTSTLPRPPVVASGSTDGLGRGHGTPLQITWSTEHSSAALGARHSATSQPGDSVVTAADGPVTVTPATPGAVPIITTVAGTGQPGFAGDGGSAVRAQLNFPSGVAVAHDGTIFVADTNNFRIRKIAPDGHITTIAGRGTPASDGDDGLATNARLTSPAGLALGPDGTLFVADTWAHRVRRISTAGFISTAAGTGIAGFGGEGRLAGETELYRPTAVAVGADSVLYISDTGNDRVRKSTGIVTTYVGGGAGGDNSPARLAQLIGPRGLAFNATGDLHVAETYGGRIVQIVRIGDQDLLRTVLIEPATRPADLGFDRRGNLFFIDGNRNVIRMTGPDGARVVAGSGGGGFDGDDGPAAAARLGAPSAIAVNSDGSFLIADSYNHRVRRVTWYAPQVTVTHTSVRASEPFAIRAFGFRPAATAVTLTLVPVDAPGDEPFELGTAALAEGRFGAEITLPSDLAAGRYQLRVSDGTLTALAPDVLTVAADHQAASAPAPVLLPIVIRAPTTP